MRSDTTLQIIRMEAVEGDEDDRLVGFRSGRTGRTTRRSTCHH
jgi:hypothetical protein